jgi:hypothetical protein
MEEQFAGVTGTAVSRVKRIEDVGSMVPEKTHKPLLWGRDRIGIGLLRALREKRSIQFGDLPSPPEHVSPKWSHLVVCEAGEDLSEVVAANYAYAMRGGLCLIPKIDEQVADDVIESFNNLNDNAERPRGDALRALQEELRRLCGPLPLEGVDSITFISRSLPFGFAFPELPTTHLFSYPDLGLAVVNAFAAEQPESRPTGVAAIVDPGSIPAPEIDLAIKRLARRGMFVRSYQGQNATVRDVSELVELFPYDVLLIATHCGDAKGYRWTYDFTDSEGYERRLVVDIALGVAQTDDPDRVFVTQFQRFVSLDGIPWNDRKKKEKLYVGSAIRDFTEWVRTRSIQPTLKETADRVRWSAALHMYDGNYISMEQSLADAGTPIIINNACGSWHRLAGTFTFAGARTYIGTLFPVMGVEAEEVTKQLLGADFGKPLPVALWNAQRKVYDDAFRRPYVIVGAFPQRLPSAKHNVARRVAGRLSRALRVSRELLNRAADESPHFRERSQAAIVYYTQELGAVLRAWPDALAPLSRRRPK